jgi:hypothetical protein
MPQNKTNDEIWSERQKGIDILQLNKGITTKQLLERQLSQTWIFSCFLHLQTRVESVELLLDLNEPQKQSILFSFFSTSHSLLSSLLAVLCLCSDIRKQNGSTSLVRAKTECCRYGSLYGNGVLCKLYLDNLLMKTNQ